MTRKKFSFSGASWKNQLSSARELALDQITADPALQHRIEINPRIVSEYAEAMKEGASFPPMKAVQDEEGTIWLYSGFQRLEAARQAELDTFSVKLERGTRRDAWLASLGENHDHGARRTRADLYNAIDNALRDSEIRNALLNGNEALWSFRKVANSCHTSHHTVKARWEKIHYPAIITDIDNSLGQYHDAFDEAGNWMGKMAQNLNVPRWLIEARYSEAHKPEPELDPRPDPIESSHTDEAESGKMHTYNQRLLDSGGVVEPSRTDEPESGKMPTDNQRALDSGGVVEPSRTDQPETGKMPTDNQKVLDLDQSADPLNRLDIKPFAHGAIQAYPSDRPPTPATKNDLIGIITGANKFGIHAYHIDRAVRVKLVYELDKGEVQELELKQPHEGVLLLHFPLVQD